MAVPVKEDITITAKSFVQAASNGTAQQQLPIPPDVEGYFKTRYIVAFVSFWGFVTSYMVRVNINLAIVDMVVPQNHSAIGPRASSSSDEDKYAWDETVQGHILGSFFFGYVTTQWIGGRLADRFGGKNIFGIPLLCGGIISIAIPHAADIGHAGAVITSMVIMGISHGFSYPAMFAILARWVPPQERSRTSSLVFAGTAFGTTITLALGGLAMKAWGWRSTFYISGGCTIVWFIFWTFLTSESPLDHPRISSQERAYLMATVATKGLDKGPKVPWRSMLTSKPVWALLVAHTGANFGYWGLITLMPSYMDEVLGYDLHHNGLLSSISPIAMFVWAQLYSLVMAKIMDKKILSVTSVRKISNSIAQGFPAICLVTIAYIEDSSAVVVLLFSLAGMFQGSIYSGCIPNHVDLAPNFAASLMGVTNTAAAILSWSAPVIAGSFTSESPPVEAWRAFFWVCAVVMVSSAIIFNIFGSGEEQPWNDPSFEPSLLHQENGLAHGAHAGHVVERLVFDNHVYRESRRRY